MMAVCNLEGNLDNKDTVFGRFYTGRASMLKLCRLLVATKLEKGVN